MLSVRVDVSDTRGSADNLSLGGADGADNLSLSNEGVMLFQYGWTSRTPERMTVGLCIDTVETTSAMRTTTSISFPIRSSPEKPAYVRFHVTCCTSPL